MNRFDKSRIKLYRTSVRRNDAQLCTNVGNQKQKTTNNKPICPNFASKFLNYEFARISGQAVA